MDRFADRLAGRLSGGMKQKLALACALVAEPRVLLLDEPTTGVDPVSRREFWDALAHLAADGLTILVATPYLDEAERCHRVALMHAGEIQQIGTPDELRASLGAHAPRSARVTTSARPKSPVGDQRADADIVDVQRFGDRLDVWSRDPRPAETARRAKQLARRRRRGQEIRVDEPTLENVFVAILRALGAGARPSRSRPPRSRDLRGRRRHRRRH